MFAAVATATEAEERAEPEVSRKSLTIPDLFNTSIQCNYGNQISP